MDPDHLCSHGRLPWTCLFCVYDNTKDPRWKPWESLEEELMLRWPANTQYGWRKPHSRIGRRGGVRALTSTQMGALIDNCPVSTPAKTSPNAPCTLEPYLVKQQWSLFHQANICFGEPPASSNCAPWDVLWLLLLWRPLIQRSPRWRPIWLRRN